MIMIHYTKILNHLKNFSYAMQRNTNIKKIHEIILRLLLKYKCIELYKINENLSNLTARA